MKGADQPKVDWFMKHPGKKGRVNRNEYDMNTVSLCSWHVYSIQLTCVINCLFIFHSSTSKLFEKAEP